MKRLFIFIFLTICFKGFTQEKKSDLKNVINIYTTALELNEETSMKFQSIIESYKEKLADTKFSPHTFNTLLKSQTLEIYELLTKDEFKMFKELRAKHQPDLKFKFN